MLTDFVGRVPPHDEDAERRVIHACLNKPDAIVRLIDVLAPGDFYLEKHARIFDSVIDLHKRGKKSNALGIIHVLRKRGNYEAVGGANHLKEINEAYPTTAGFMDAAEIVHETSRVRAVIGACLDALQKGYSDYGDVEAFAHETASALSDIAARSNGHDVLHLGKVAEDLYNEVLSKKKPDLGLLTRIPDLDRMTGGLQPGELTVVAGPTSMGKTAFATAIGVDVSVPTLMFSLEQPKRQLAYRVIAAQSGVPVQRLRRPDEWSESEDFRIHEAIQLALKREFYLDDRTRLTTAQIRSSSRMQHSRRKIGLIIIDYLGLIEAVGKKNGTREQEVAEMTKDLKSLAIELNIPIILISQMNRAYAHRTNPRPRTEDLRDSGAIGHDADLLIFPWRPMQLQDPKEKAEAEKEWVTRGELEPAEIIIAKNRNGPVGSVPAWWDKDRMVFRQRDDQIDLDATMRRFKGGDDDNF